MSASAMPPEFLLELRTLLDQYRDLTLWFLREDYFPSTAQDAHRVLAYVQRHGDRAAFVRARELDQWLSRLSSATSAAS